jgi:hypothetical protein
MLVDVAILCLQSKRSDSLARLLLLVHLYPENNLVDYNID